MRRAAVLGVRSEESSMKRVDFNRERNLNWSFSWKRVQKLSVLMGIFWNIKDFLIITLNAKIPISLLIMKHKPFFKRSFYLFN